MSCMCLFYLECLTLKKSFDFDSKIASEQILFKAYGPIWNKGFDRSDFSLTWSQWSGNFFCIRLKFGVHETNLFLIDCYSLSLSLSLSFCICLFFFFSLWRYFYFYINLIFIFISKPSYNKYYILRWTLRAETFYD